MEHKFNIQFAKDYGIEEAIILDNIYFWIAQNVANEKHKHDGRYWTYNSAKAFSELFPYMNGTKIYRVLTNLENLGLIIKGNFNKEKYDRTNWFSFTDAGLCKLTSENYDVTDFSDTFQNDEMEFAKMQNGICKNAKSISISNIKETITDNKITDNKKEEGINIPSKKNDYQAIIDCWNEYNGKKLGKVTKITDKRKKAIKKALDDNGITQEQMMTFFKTLPYADKWLYNPNKQHANWKPDFDWWMANVNGWLTKALEGKVHSENPQAFSIIMLGKDAPYTPMCDGAISWNDYYNCYILVGMYYGKVFDGYTDDNRPNGARILLGNGGVFIVWNSETKTWDKEK